MSKETEYVWIVNRDWKDGFRPIKVLKSEADNYQPNLKQHKTEAEAWETISKINIEPDH